MSAGIKFVLTIACSNIYIRVRDHKNTSADEFVVKIVMTIRNACDVYTLIS